MLDLTEGNPAAAGLTEDGAWRAALAAAGTLRYEPAPRGLESARRAVSAYYRERGVRIEPEDLVLTAGTSESYAHLFRLLCDPGDTVLVPRPGYPLFEPLAAAEGVTTASYRLVRQEGRFVLDRESLAHAPSTVRALIVVQPNPPAGSLLDDGDLEYLDGWCAERDVALISDEVFSAFPHLATTDPRTELPSLLGGARRATTFVLSGISKLCGLPQLKLGWIAVAGPGREHALEGLEWISDLFLSVGTPVQHALPEILETRHGFRERVLARNAAHLAMLAAAPGVTPWPAAGGWSAVVELPARHDDEAWALRLLERGVAVHAGHFYDLEEPSCIVVSLIARPPEFAAGWQLLKETVTRF